MTFEDAKVDFDNSLSHIRTTYRYCLACIPRPEQFAAGLPVRIGRFEFEKPNQAESMRIELSWAFFPRLVAAFEVLRGRFEKCHNIIKKRHTEDVLKESGQFSKEDLEGISIAREIRNIILHGDGDSSILWKTPEFVRSESSCEPHIEPEHMERFFELYRKAAGVLALRQNPESQS